MDEKKNFETLEIDLLVDLLDQNKNGKTSLNRLLALGNKLSTDRVKNSDTVKKSAMALCKAFILGIVVIIFGVLVFMELEYDGYEEKIESNLLVKADIEIALPVGDVMGSMLNLTSQYNDTLDTTLRAMWQEYLNQTLWDKLEDNGFVATYALDNPWRFESASWFVFTVATTVGYGHIVPNTTAGYLFLIFYSIPAIIWTGVFIKKLINFYKSWPCKLGSVKLKLMSITVMFMLYLSISGYIFSKQHDGWSTMQGVYFTWVTISTIGFGDYTFEDGKWWQNMLNLFIIVNGLFLASYVISVVGDVIERFTKPERWTEVFEITKLANIEAMIPMKIFRPSAMRYTDESSRTIAVWRNQTLGEGQSKEAMESLRLDPKVWKCTRI